MTGSPAPPGSGENTLTVSQSSGSAPGATGAVGPSMNADFGGWGPDGGRAERYAAEHGHAVLRPPAYLPGGRTDHGLGYIHPHPFGDEPETSGCGPLWPPGRTLRHRVQQHDWNFARRGVHLVVREMGHTLLLRGPDRGALVALGHPGPGPDGGRADLGRNVGVGDQVAEPLRVARLPPG